MEVINACGDKLNPTASVPVQAGDTIKRGSRAYKIKSVTNTGLVKFENRENMGKAEFTAWLIDSSRIEITRDIVNINEVSEAEFNYNIRGFQVKDPDMAAFLTIPVDADKYYLTESYGAGFAIDEDNLVGLFNDTDDSGTGHSLVGEAIRKGASRLMSFDTKLTSIYESWGFEIVDRSGWDESMAPQNWNYERFGRPDVVWMEL